MTQTSTDISKSLPLLDTDVLRSFTTIAESGSFTRAAELVFRTPSALSMQIKRLEELLGHVLFVREARSVRLTPEGELLLSFARRLLKLNEEAVAQFLAPAVEGAVTIGMTDDIGSRLLPNILAQFAGSYPAVQVTVVVEQTIQLRPLMIAGELDLALVTRGQSRKASVPGEVLHTEPLVWVGRENGIAWQRSPLPIALASHNCGCTWRRMALDALDKADIEYRIAYNVNSRAGQEAAMIADLAVSPFPRSLVKPPLRQLDERTGLPMLGSYQIELIKRDALGPAGEALGQFIEQSFQQLGR